MECKFSKNAVSYIKSQDKITRQRIKKAIDGLMEEPPRGDIKPLKGYKENVYRLRIGGYRIIYEFCHSNQETYLHIKEIGSRGDIYK